MTYTPLHTYDAIPSSPDIRDFRPRAINTAALPPVVALPPVPVLDQAQEGSCVGHGCAGAREVLEAIANGAAPFVPLSRAYIYYKARSYEHTTRQDAGAEVRDGCKVLQKLGAPPESAFPYVVGGFAKAPSGAATKAAHPYKIAAYTRLGTPDEVRAAIANRSPVIIGISVYQSFEQIGGDGVVPLPHPSEQLLGGHCVFLHGYHPDPAHPGAFIFDGQNSWGPGWADHGRMHFPQEYIANPNLTSDLWAIVL